MQSHIETNRKWGVENGRQLREEKCARIREGKREENFKVTTWIQRDGGVSNESKRGEQWRLKNKRVKTKRGQQRKGNID